MVFRKTRYFNVFSEQNDIAHATESSKHPFQYCRRDSKIKIHWQKRSEETYVWDIRMYSTTNFLNGNEHQDRSGLDRAIDEAGDV